MEIPMGSKLLTPDRDFLERDRKDRKRDLTPGEVYPAEMEVKKRKSEECLPNTKRRKMEIPMGAKDLHESRSKHRPLLTPDRDFLERDRKDRKRDLTPGEVYPAEMEVKKRKSEECLPKPSKINRESELQGRKQRHSEEYERDSPRKLKARAHHYSPNSMGGKRVRGGWCDRQATPPIAGSSQ